MKLHHLLPAIFAHRKPWPLDRDQTSSHPFGLPWFLKLLAGGVIIGGLGVPSVTGAPPEVTSAAEVERLMARMTLEEKVGQLNMLSAGRDATGPVLSTDAEAKIMAGQVGSLLNAYGLEEVRKFQRLAVEHSRLGIPLLFAFDVIHGHRTIFPINLGLSCSWDFDLIERVSRRAAAEAWADGLHWTFAPMVDISRDPRWGRVAEGAGEDPWLGARVAEAAIRGFQGPGPAESGLGQSGRVLATVKHFALYGAPDGGRDYHTTDMSRHRMFNEYLEPYSAGVAAGAGSVMTAFNEVDGIPATGNRWLLRDLLRGQWGFDGVLVSDYCGIQEMVMHGMGEEAEVVRLAVSAGVDVDMVGESFWRHLPELVRAGVIPESLVDEACRRVLLAKWRLGLFSDPLRREAGPEPWVMDRELALEAAVKSMVLLKNEGQVLPLRQEGEKVLFVGPFVSDRHHQLGAWRAAGDARLAVSLAEALRGGGADFIEAVGCPLLDGASPEEERQMLTEALALAADCDKIVVYLGEPSEQSGEAASKTDIRLPGPQRRLLAALKGTGKPLILVLATGRPLALAEEEPLVEAILVAWFGGHLAGPAIADLLYGKAQPEGRLTMSFPRSVGQIPVYYNHKQTGRPRQEGNHYTSKYLDSPNEPLYPFGYGLSYSPVHYSPPVLSRDAFRPGESITVSTTLTNAGSRATTEIAQLYLRDVAGSVTRPVRELKGSQRVALSPGESRQVEFEITEPMLRFYDAEMRHRSEPGRFLAFISAHSATGEPVEFRLEE